MRMLNSLFIYLHAWGKLPNCRRVWWNVDNAMPFTARCAPCCLTLPHLQIFSFSSLGPLPITNNALKYIVPLITFLDSFYVPLIPSKSPQYLLVQIPEWFAFCLDRWVVLSLVRGWSLQIVLIYGVSSLTCCSPSPSFWLFFILYALWA